MDLKEADKIREAWGKFLEVSQPQLIQKYHAEIPVEFLPYPKDKIEEAMDVCIDHFRSEGEFELVKTFDAAKTFLLFYK